MKEATEKGAYHVRSVFAKYISTYAIPLASRASIRNVRYELKCDLVCVSARERIVVCGGERRTRGPTHAGGGASGITARDDGLRACCKFDDAVGIATVRIGRTIDTSGAVEPSRQRCRRLGERVSVARSL